MEITKVYNVQIVKSSFRAKSKRQQDLLRHLHLYMSCGSPRLYKQTLDCTVLYQLLDNAELTSRPQILCPSKISVVLKALIPAYLVAKFLFFQAVHSPILILKGPDLQTVLQARLGLLHNQRGPNSQRAADCYHAKGCRKRVFLQGSERKNQTSRTAPRSPIYKNTCMPAMSEAFVLVAPFHPNYN